MTDEFAIKVLKELRGYGDKFANIGYDRKEALDMGIKALEQQPMTMQEKQAESEKNQKAFDDGYENGYAQARFDYEQDITWITGKDNCQVAVRNMPIDKMQKICAIIGDEEQQLCKDMRDATEERESTKNYIDSISKPTGLQFDDIYEELDFVQPHKKISVNLQPCEDCVSRAYIESIVEELENICINGDEHILSLLSNIKNAPSVTLQQTRWILVSERLPEDGERVLVTYDKIVIRATWDLMRYSFYDTKAKSLDKDFVYAWMPLPEPYKAESEEDGKHNYILS